MNHEDSTKQDNRPSMQWYPDDWWAEVSLKLCSMAAQGLWFNMLNIMFMANPRGKLIANGKQLHSKEIARILGQDVNDVEEWLKELADNNLYSIDESGCIYSRRMYRDWREKKEQHEKKAEAGRLGAEKRWGKDSNDVAKMASSTSSSTPTPSPSSNIDKSIKKRRLPDRQVQEVIDYATAKGFSLQGSKKGNRYAASNLIKRHDPHGVPLGVARVKKLIDLAMAVRTEQFAPQCSDFQQLQRKWQNLLDFADKKKGGGCIG